MFSAVKPSDNVLFLWAGSLEERRLQEKVEDLRKVTNKVTVDNIDRLFLARHSTSSFDVVLSGVIFPQTTRHSSDILKEILRVLKPSGVFIIQEPVCSETNVADLRSKQQLLSAIKVMGFTNTVDRSVISLSETELQNLKKLLKVNGDLSIAEIHAQKPNFEIGSAIKLPFATQINPAPDVAAVWKLSDTVDDDIETIDSNNLLDEEDLQKPDPSKLKVCGTTGKRKACKNCSCGLAEELATEKTSETETTKTSACGNCYLGDAFRCSTCPYLGMPAFKPGEKIQLSDLQLKADV